MSTETPPDSLALKEAFDHDIYSPSGNPLKFGSLFYDCDVYPAEKRILVVFIRHFFCGNCQEYVRRLASAESPFHPSHKSTSTTWTTNSSKPASRTLPTVVIIGPGQPSLIASYKALTQCPFDIYADPSTQLYNILGMHRTLSMGSRSPGYIEHSLISGAVKSAWQIVRRVGTGDAMAGGNWDVNGGEFLFTRSAVKPSSRRNLNWEATWCHRMANSRDHTELIDLAYHTCFSVQSSAAVENKSRTSSPAPPLKSILVNGDKTHAKSLSHSYSSERLGSCPAPEIPKSRGDALTNTRTRSNSQTKSKSPHRPRSRSTSITSRATARQNHERVWSIMSTTDTLRSDSRASNTIARETPVSPISEVEEEEMKPRKSFSASVADALGVRTMLKRSKSMSGSSKPDETEQNVPRPSTSLSDVRSGSRSSTNTNTTGKQRSRSTSGPMTLPRSKSRTKQQSSPPLAQTSSADTPFPARSKSPTKTHTRNRTFSFSSSKSGTRHKPSLSLTKKSSGTVEMDDNGVMFVDGVEFVNVISVKARVESDEEEQRRQRLRERADSGLGMDVTRSESAVGTRALRQPPPVPVAVPVQHFGMTPYTAVTALPEVVAVH
ncbi:hypothetical protein H2200_013515 [Cladophialophora chaetospira]|uniref:Uncharacterized protein n=1 Tax=Cladophialophora chaetospira TaxID=386627 RepID=A0AA38U9F5_9EURO|nr:hypothetical protein H2200_013515 [Cladophialophora chaetospira]